MITTTAVDKTCSVMWVSVCFVWRKWQMLVDFLFYCRSCGTLCFGLLDPASYVLFSRQEKATFLLGLKPSNRIIVGRMAVDSEPFKWGKYIEAKLGIRIGSNLLFIYLFIYLISMWWVSRKHSTKHTTATLKFRPSRLTRMAHDSVTRKAISYRPSALFKTCEYRFISGFLNGAGSCLNAGCMGPTHPSPPPPNPQRHLVIYAVDCFFVFYFYKKQLELSTLACLVNLVGPLWPTSFCFFLFKWWAWKCEHVLSLWVRISVSPQLFPASFLPFRLILLRLQDACCLVFCITSTFDLYPPSVSCVCPPPHVNLAGKRVAALTSSPLLPNPSPKSKN